MRIFFFLEKLEMGLAKLQNVARLVEQENFASLLESVSLAILFYRPVKESFREVERSKLVSFWVKYHKEITFNMPVFRSEGSLPLFSFFNLRRKLKL